MRGSDRTRLRWVLFVYAVLLPFSLALAAEPMRRANVADLVPIRPSELQVSTTSDGMHMEGEGHAATNRKFPVPVRIDVVARTDSTNIRLYFGEDGRLIFNWEMDQNELRYHDPVGGRESHQAGKGHIPPRQWTKLTWIIDETRSRILVNDQERASIPGNHKGLSLPVGIGPGARSKIDVRSIKISGKWGTVSSDKTDASSVAAASADAPAAKTGSYGEPNVAAAPINAARLKLSPESRAKLTDALASYAQATADPADPASLARASHAIGVVLLLDPQNRTAILVNARLRAGQRPPTAAQPTSMPASALAATLVQSAAEAQKLESKDDKLLAAHVYSICTDIAPDNQEALYQSEILRRGGMAANWSWAGGGGSAGGGDAPLGFDASPNDEPGSKFLVDLPEKYEGLTGGGWSLGKGTMNGNEPNKGAITVGGTPAPRGLGVHPRNDSDSRVTYTLPRGSYKRLIGGAGLNDSAANGSTGSVTPLTFSVVGNGRTLWTSKPMQRAGSHQEFNVSVANVTKLELVVRCPGTNMNAHAVWINPRLTGGDASAAEPTLTDASNANPPSIANPPSAGQPADVPEVSGGAAAYPAPDLSAPIFDATKLSITPQQRKAIADTLTAHVRSQLKLDQAKDLALASRMLGIALRVDAENRDAMVLNARLRRGNRTAGAAATTSSAPFALQLHPLAQACVAADKPDDRALATYLYSLMVTVDPTNDDALFQSERLSHAGLRPRWDWASGGNADAAVEETPPPAPGATAIKSIARRQSSIKGLAVIASSNGDLIGITSDVIITATPGMAPPGNNDGARFTRDVGEQMKTALAEAIRTIRVRYPEWEQADIQISFEDKYAKQDGGSAGGAFGVLLLSVLEGFDIDPQAAITGDITVDGKLRRIGGVDAKVRAAVAGGATTVTIPLENADAVEDYLVLNGIKALWDIQILGAGTLSDAVRNVRTDREPAMAEAITAFAAVQSACRKSGASALNTPDVKSKLDRVLSLAPNHLSAKYLRLAVDRKQPTKLSIGMSLYQMFRAIYPIQDSLWTGNPPPDDASRSAGEIRLHLRELLRTCHPDTAKLVVAVQDFSEASLRARARGNNAELDKSRRAVAGELDRLQTRRETMEELLRKGA